MNYVHGWVCAFSVQTWCRESSLSVSDWANWAQAVTAMAAIVAGASAIWWQVARQQRHEERLRLADEVRRLQIVASGIFHARVYVELIGDFMSKRHNAGYLEEALRRYVDLLMRIPALEVPDFRASVAIATTAGILSRLQQAFDDARRDPQVSEWEKEIAEGVDALRHAESIVRATLRGRKADVAFERIDAGNKVYASRARMTGEWQPE